MTFVRWRLHVHGVLQEGLKHKHLLLCLADSYRVVKHVSYHCHKFDRPYLVSRILYLPGMLIRVFSLHFWFVCLFVSQMSNTKPATTTRIGAGWAKVKHLTAKARAKLANVVGASVATERRSRSHTAAAAAATATGTKQC